MAGIVHYLWLVFIILVCNSAYNLDIFVSSERTEQHPARDFSRHTLVKPRIYHGREKRQISSTKEENGKHTHILTIILKVDEEDFILDLTLNNQLIPKGFFHKYQENGKNKLYKPTAQEVELCHYNGKVRGRPDSWVALSTCDGLSGVIFDGQEMHYIEKSSKVLNSQLENDHFLYKHSDLVEHNKTCGYEGDAVEHLKDNRILRYKRAADQNELVRGPYNANKESKYVELVLVLDNREFKDLGESRSKVEHHAKSIANIINGLYAPLNIFIALVGVVVWTEHDEISFSPNGDTTLTNFLHYRREQLIKDHPNDNAQLLTKFTFENGVVGKALKGPICTYEYSGGVNTDHSSVVGLVATTVAHEMGHNFGMEHDTTECKCPDERCIMAPSSSTIAPTHWSSCSLNYLLLAFTHGMDYCLKNKPESLFGSPVCGNGFVEPGEQCDCGMPEHCDNTCCNATSCMLHSNASCATGECCDLTTCRPKNAGTVCRAADYECDLPEYCTGQSEYCPTDIYKMDTETCDGGNAFCYHGFCRTRTDQCKLLWGETGRSSDDQCYEMNQKGTRHGNCGYNKTDKSFSKCNEENILCGMLHCKHLNERLEFGMESVAILSHTFINKKGSIIPCRTAIVDLGINEIDPGLAPDGAKCGEDKMCVNQKCMSVSSLRKQGPSCPHDCNGNGWCNNLGHCHCEDGFAYPYCDYPGPGGSEDSGPATDPNSRQGFVTAMFVIFLGVIPLVAIIAFLTYYAQQNLVFSGRKPPAQMYVINSVVNGVQHVLSACKGVGSSLRNPTVPTVSQHVSKKESPSNNRNIVIQPTGLISTTNSDGINRSNTITNSSRYVPTNNIQTDQTPIVKTETGGRRMSFKNIKKFSFSPSLKMNKSDKDSSESSNIPAQSLNSKTTPILKQEQSAHRLSFKNMKGFKLNTNFKLSRSNESSKNDASSSKAESKSDEFSKLSVKELARQFNENKQPHPQV